MIAQPIKNNIITQYNSGITISQLSKIYRYHFKTIRKLLTDNNIEIRTTNTWTRKYFYDTHFFRKINTEEKAYFLGFLYADGCVTNNGLNLLIHPNDIEILEKFKKSIKFTGNIEFRTEKRKNNGKYKNLIEKTAKIRIHSKEIIKDLVKLGCFQRKTFKLKFPTPQQVPHKFIVHFIRGFFDGDGSVYERKYTRKDGKKRGFAQITSTLNMIKNIKNILVKEFNIKRHSLNIKPHPTSNRIFILMIASFPGMKIFRNILYKDASIYLKRKKNKFDDLYLGSEFCHSK
ncbi:MAG: LAGLIDADG family homing endonuclease [bacterium]|nr:LAGLIDADG family homing endonuclease [bacterium]